ncbi:MAG: FAD:protein FMN transferase [Phycisphaerales bacterium]
MHFSAQPIPNEPHRDLSMTATQARSQPGGVILATNAMGTRFELVLCESTHHAAGSHESQVFLQAVGEQVIEEIQFWDRTLSRFTPGSVPARLIQAAANNNPNHFVPLDARVFSLLQLCESMRTSTQGAFDISFASNRTRAQPAGLLFDETSHAARLSYPDQTLDFGAVGKGFALDCVAEILREHGVTKALIHGGTSSILALGDWTIGVKIDEARECVIAMRNSHLSVSSTMHRTHIVDARVNSNQQTTSAVNTAAVLFPLSMHTGPNNLPIPSAGTLAEVWSTSLTLLGFRIPAVPTQLTTLLARNAHDLELQGPDVHCFRTS